jgi:signal transduction histidine kinase/CheY-like chemotaxis protein
LDPAWLEAIGREEQKDRVPLDWWLSLMEGESRNKVRAAIDEHLANRSKHAEIEYEVRAKTGGTKWFWWRGKCLSRDEAGVPLRMIGSQRDITERKRLDEERLNLEEQVRHAQKLESLGVLAGGIAHDFNNLLMGILGNADLALYEISPVSPVCANLREIETAAKRAADLCRQMLAYSGKGAFLIATVRINEIIQEMAHLLEVSISKKVALRFEFAKDLPPIECDVTQFRQIVMNLITNASDAIGDDNGIITVRTGLLHCDRDYLKGVYVHDNLPESDYVYLEVSDSGCGMDRATLERIFEPFFTTKFTGRGLGMSAVLGIVRSHGGAIKIYSEPGKGSMFRVLFPPSSKRPQSAVEGFVKSDGWKGSGRVLLVDDEETILTVGTRMLNLMGFEVLPARDGIEALEVFKANADTIRCVILDLTMPRMSGEETFRALNALDSRVPILLSSGYTEQEVNGRFSGKRVAGFIQKPYQYHSLLARMRQALDPAKEGDTDPDEMERS